ncbi:MAG TPA: trehalose-phosphatase [Actinomycetota bacterium]|nr:trehalose-phosphatase [Actinomycetota bacterium]
MEQATVAIRTDEIDAVVFDMDGVVTDTASVHAAAWARMFDRFLKRRASATGATFMPFTEDDYRRYIDGKPRYDGVSSFLAAREIMLPYGDSSDPPEVETVCGLGNRKDQDFLEHLRRDGVAAFPTTVVLVERLRGSGVRTAVISASRNLDAVLAAGGVEDLFEVRVGGAESERLGLAGKPDPAVFLEATRRLGVVPRRTAVVEDALAGVQAGRSGGFGLVIGVDRTGHRADLEAAGADVVVGDLGEVTVQASRRSVRDLPDALAARDEIRERLRGRAPAVFLDYDGTLTPIVERPEDARLPDPVRRALERLASRRTVAVISGRDLADVRRMMGVDGIAYAGSHGFDIAGPGALAEQHAVEVLPELDRAEEELRPMLEPVPGVRLERKRFAIAVHVRQVEERRVPDVEAAVDRAAGAHPRLRKTVGKKVIELRPNVEWDKGRAVLRLMDVLELDRADVLPVYVGDDVTDEDAFSVVRDRGLGVVVRGEDDDRPTSARYSLAASGEIVAFLAELASLEEETAPARDPDERDSSEAI